MGYLVIYLSCVLFVGTISGGADFWTEKWYYYYGYAALIVGLVLLFWLGVTWGISML